MKKILCLLMLCLPLIAKSQDSKWTLLVADSANKEKTLIDKERTLKYNVFDAKFNVVIIWIRKLSKPTKSGEYLQQDDEKVAVAVSDNQVELKARLVKYNTQMVSQEQFDEINWHDIYPESIGETYLAYCKQYLETSK